MSKKSKEKNFKKKIVTSRTAKRKHIDKKIMITIPIILIITITFYFFFSWNTSPYLTEPQKNDLPQEDEKEDNISESLKSSVHISSMENETSESKDKGNLGGSGGGGSGESSEDTELGCEVFSGNQRDWCYRDEAIENKDPSFCLKIQDSYNRDSCYRYLALETGDQSYCDYMQDEFRRLWCHEAFK